MINDGAEWILKRTTVAQPYSSLIKQVISLTFVEYQTLTFLSKQAQLEILFKGQLTSHQQLMMQPQINSSCAIQQSKETNSQERKTPGHGQKPRLGNVKLIAKIAQPPNLHKGDQSMETNMPGQSQKARLGNPKMTAKMTQPLNMYGDNQSMLQTKLQRT